MQNKLNKNLTEKSGQGLMEYIILTGLIGIFCLGIVGTFGKTLQKRIQYMKEQITENLKVN